MTVIKRNQIIALSIAVMIVAAGYLSYTNKEKTPYSQELSGDIGTKFSSERLGEATLVEDLDSADIATAEPASSTTSNTINTQEKTGTTNTSLKQDDNALYFQESRSEKERVRDEETEIFEKVLSSKTATAESQLQAQNQLTAISQKWEKEMIIERLIKAKGFKDVVAFINEPGINIVVLNGIPLTEQQVAQIQDIVIREAKISADNIKIVGK